VGSAARRPDYNPVAVTLEGCLHRFVRPESLGAHDRWICTRRALRVGVSVGVWVRVRDRMTSLKVLMVRQ